MKLFKFLCLALLGIAIISGVSTASLDPESAAYHTRQYVCWVALGTAFCLIFGAIVFEVAANKKIRLIARTLAPLAALVGVVMVLWTIVFPVLASTGQTGYWQEAPLQCWFILIVSIGSGASIITSAIKRYWWSVPPPNKISLANLRRREE